MNYESQLNRYFELQTLLKSGSHIGNEDSLENEYKELTNSLYGIFMVSRIKLNLPPSIKFDEWIKREYEQLSDIKSLLSDVDSLMDKNQNNSIKQNDYSQIWMKNICEALNQTSVEVPKAKGGGKWTPAKFSSVVEFIKEHITFDRGIYNYLNDKGLINTGRCPITGQSINRNHFYQFFGRKVYLSEEGKEIAKEIDRQDHIKTFGKEPMSSERKAELRQEIIQKQGNKILSKLVIGAILLFVLFKTCS